MNDVNETSLRKLLSDIKSIQGWEAIFFEKDAKNTIRANHQKGHIKDNQYVRHTEINNKKKAEARVNQKQPRPRIDNPNRKHQ